MAEPGIRELLEAGLHFGHQTRRWNPRMQRYIWGERDGIHIVDLLQTERLLAEARSFAEEVAGRGGTILFVGTKKQARDAIREWAERTEMPYVNLRWLGGLLTNFQTISKRIDRLHDLDALKQGGQLDLLPTKERMSMEAELERLTYNLGGVRDMKRLPQAVLIADLKTEEIALREAQRLRIPITRVGDRLPGGGGQAPGRGGGAPARRGGASAPGGGGARAARSGGCRARRRRRTRSRGGGGQWC